MTSSPMKPYSTLAIVIIMLAVSFPPTTNAQYPPCVDYSLAHKVGVSAPVNTGVLASYNPTLTLPIGTSRYTYSATGSVPLHNFFLVLNSSTAWTPFAPIPTTPNTVSFNFHIPTPQPLCSTKDIRVQFERQRGMGWVTTCTFDLNVTVTENGARKNMTGVEGLSKVYYAGSDYKAYSLTWNSPVVGIWNYAAVNVIGGWGAVQIDGEMTSFADGSRIFFKGKDSKLYNLIQGAGNNWTLSLVMAGLPNVSGNVAARNSNEVVFFGGGQLHQLLLSGSTWTNQTVIPTGGWSSSNGGVPNGDSIYLSNGSSDIFFSNGPAAVARVYQSTSGSPWTYERISPANVPSGYVYESDLLAVENYAVYYKGQDKAIHRYLKCGATWKLDAMPISPPSENNVVVLRAFMTKFPGEDRVFYKAATGRIYNLYNVNGVWFNYPLDTAMVNAAGDLMAFEAKLFFINHDKRIHNYLWGGSSWFGGPVSHSAPANVKGCIPPYY